MKLEDIRLAIRPRSTLECYDLAFMCCGRHAISLVIAAALGIVPVMFLNSQLFVDEEPGTAVLQILAMLIEIPWVTAGITLYLGQATFSKRFSWRQAGWAALGGLWQMIFYQGFLRTIALVMVITSPAVMVGLYFTNEIILLERTKFGRTWSRHGALSTRAIGGIIQIRLVDMLILLLSYPVISGMLRAISALWQDRYIWSPEDMLEWSPEQMLPTLTWESQLAFWLIMSFLTVSRFMYYMDCRIRSEGWDVELLLKTQASVLRPGEVE